MFEMRLAANFVFLSAYMMFHAGKNFFPDNQPLVAKTLPTCGTFWFQSRGVKDLRSFYHPNWGHDAPLRRPLPRNVVPVPGAAPRPKAVERRVLFFCGRLFGRFRSHSM